VTITWDNNVIQNQWLQVTVKANINTGLGAADVFYFGNAIGESGNSTTDAVVDLQDEIGSRSNKTGFTAAAIDNHYDYNRDGRVNATDDLIARHNRTDGAGGNPLQLITAPVSAPPASGDTLQPLSAAADIAITQPVTSLADIAASQPVASSQDNAMSQTAALSVKNITSRPLTPSEDRAASNLEMPSAREISEALSAFAPVQTTTASFTSFPRSSVGMQFPVVLHPHDVAGNSILFSMSHDNGASDQWVPTPERGNRINNAPHNRTAPVQDLLHDAVFARSIARFSLSEENNLPDDLSTTAEIEAFLNESLPPQSDKSLAHTIDGISAADGPIDDVDFFGI
jgi:hypothetical protein